MNAELSPGVIRCPDCDLEGNENTCITCSNNGVVLAFLNAYHVQQAYGGSEEGGWWYEAGEALASIPLNLNTTVEDVRRYERSLTDRFSDEYHDPQPLSNVNSRGKLVIRKEAHFASNYPKTRPQYS